MQTYINNLVRCNALVSAGERPLFGPLFIRRYHQTPPSTSMDSCGNMLALPLCLQVGGWEGHVGGHADVMEPWLSKVWLKALLEQIFLFLAAF